MKIFTEILEVITVLIEVVAIIVLLLGVASAVIGFIKLLFTKKDAQLKHPILLVKIELGRYILLSLEFLIAADIIDSVLDPNWQGILMLAAIVAIRTLISFFLNHEISETDEKIIEKEEEEAKKSALTHH